MAGWSSRLASIEKARSAGRAPVASLRSAEASHARRLLDSGLKWSWSELDWGWLAPSNAWVMN